MELSYETIGRVLESLGCEHAYEWCGEYGESGYNARHGATTPLVVLGDWWCRCDKFGKDARGYNELHGVDRHHPRLFAQLEAQGVELEWHDEWMIDYENDKAWRTSGDSYSWQPSVIYTDDGNPLTPDSDPDDVITYVVNEPSRCITSPFGGARLLMDHGFTPWPVGAEPFENGWHPGQNDDPTAITLAIRAELVDDVDIAFAIDENGPFYIRFSAYVRSADDED